MKKKYFSELSTTRKEFLGDRDKLSTFLCSTWYYQEACKVMPDKYFDSEADSIRIMKVINKTLN